MLKGISGYYSVKTKNGIVNAVVTGNLKKEEKILIGDNVEVASNDYGKDAVITKILPRKNSLVRPTVANVDQLIIVISEKPKPDLFLVDKLIINCFVNNIEPILAINKTDIVTNKFLTNIVSQYKNVVKHIVLTSAANKNVEDLQRFLTNKVSVFAGQSAVGKSSILNVLNPSINQSTNELSKKVERGKHTTRVCEIFEFDQCLIIDTPGFSMLEFNNFEPNQLESYYPEFNKHKPCKFNTCVHINSASNNCGVISALNNGEINAERYERYVILYNKLKDAWGKRYD